MRVGDMTASTYQPLVQLRNIHTAFEAQSIHEGLNLDVYQGERLAIVGGSGSGKSLLLSEIALLREPQAGEIRLFNQNPRLLNEKQLLQLRKKMGMMFQQGALFSSLTLLENILLPLREHQRLPASLLQELAMLKLRLTGLPSHAANKYPQELSGGMLKRAAVARALALDPNLLLLDEPTAGLDPASASAFDDMLLELHATMDLTLILVTHDLDSMWRVTDQVAFLGQKQLLCKAPIEILVQQDHPEIRHYFANTRATGAQFRQTGGPQG